MDELQKRGYSLLVTARDCFQVRELAELFHLDFKLIGRHPGKSDIRKMAALFWRGLRMVPLARKEKPNLAVSHGSRSQLIACTSLRIPALAIRDYEFSTPLPLFLPTWLMCPEVIPSAAAQCGSCRILRYPGIKEDVYVPRFVPDSSIRPQLSLREEDVVVTLRPPASEAHYRNPQSEELFDAAITFLIESKGVKLVVLPRNEKQTIELKERWPELFANGTMRIPAQVVDGLNLIWHSDLVISGGGTMNREAAALGVPVYSVFRGKIGAVDQYLAHQGRLVLLKSVEDVRSKIDITRRDRPERPRGGESKTLRTIVEHIMAVMGEKRRLPGASEDIGLNQLASASRMKAPEFGSPK
jgi:hypothetical protein